MIFKRKNRLGEYLGGFFDSLFENLASEIKGMTSEAADKFLKMVEKRIFWLQKRIIYNLAFALFVMAAIIAFILSLAFYLVEFHQVSLSVAALVAGIILLIFGLIIKAFTFGGYNG